MGESPLTKLITLVTFDLDTKKMSDTVHTLERELEQTRLKKRELNDTLEVAQQAVHTAKKEVAAAELKVKDLDTQIQTKKERIEAAASPKEYRALMAEMDVLSTRQLAQEEELLATWGRYEQRKRFYEDRVQSHAQDSEQIQASLLEQQNILQTRKEELRERETLRDQYIQGVPEEWLEKYAAMRARVANPIVPVEQDACSACFYGLSEQELVQLRRRALLQCKDCYRFLYDPSVHQLT